MLLAEEPTVEEDNDELAACNKEELELTVAETAAVFTDETGLIELRAPKDRNEAELFNNPVLSSQLVCNGVAGVIVLTVREREAADAAVTENDDFPALEASEPRIVVELLVITAELLVVEMTEVGTELVGPVEESPLEESPRAIAPLREEEDCGVGEESRFVSLPPTQSCNFRICFLRSKLRQNPFPQFSQVYGFFSL